MRQMFTALTTTLMIGAASLAYADGAHACGGGKGGHVGHGRPNVMASDANGDGKVERAELAQGLAARGQEMMAKVDTNKDGFIDAGEREAAKAAHQAEREARKAEREAAGEAKPDGERGRGFGKHGPRGEGRMAKRFERLDTDGDGRLSVAELQAQTTAMVDRIMSKLDANNDGVIDAAEAAAAKGHGRDER